MRIANETTGSLYAKSGASILQTLQTLCSSIAFRVMTQHLSITKDIGIFSDPQEYNLSAQGVS